MKRFVFTLITALVPIAVIVALLSLSSDLLRNSLEPRLLRYLMAQMPSSKLQRYYRAAVNEAGFFWETVPDPNVARIAKPEYVGIHKQAEVQINNAGMRSGSPYVAKETGTYRIICLGDSYVFGTAGLEEDRFCEQLERFYSQGDITVEGKTIETYAVGLDSWTAVQQATYLSSRISEFDPDLIIMMPVANDITDLTGVTGGGMVTHSFSPEHRDWGSGVFSSSAGGPFGLWGYSILTTDFTPEGVRRWDKAMRTITRLEDLQARRGGKMVLMPMWRTGAFFLQLFRKFALEYDLSSPVVPTNYFADEGNRLPHDAHPNRPGHWILAAHQINTLHDLGWIPVAEDMLPGMHAELSTEPVAGPNETKLAAHRAGFLRRLPEEIDFRSISQDTAYALLGGVFPEKRGSEVDLATWATIRSGFTLRYPDGGDSVRLSLRIRVPARSELFPFVLDVTMDGKVSQSFRLESEDQAGEHIIELPLPASPPLGPVLEILLETESYFSGIEDGRMKSYELLHAALTPRA